MTGWRARTLAMAMTLAVATPLALHAQTGTDGDAVVNETLGVTIVGPQGWESVKAQGNDKSVANFRHPESQSQIEVIGTRLFNKDVAEVFFETFHQQLLATEFTETKAASETSLGAVEGKLSEYTFEHTGIRLRVVVFSFLRNESAYLVIGYFKEEERDAYFPAMQQVVETLQFSS